MSLKFARPDAVLYNSLRLGEAIDEGFVACGMIELVTAQSMIETYHGRGSDEQIHWALKDFGFEQLPFRRFSTTLPFATPCSWLSSSTRPSKRMSAPR